MLELEFNIVDVFAESKFGGNQECFVSAKFGPLMMILKRWFANNKITQGDVNEYQEKTVA